MAVAEQTVGTLPDVSNPAIRLTPEVLDVLRGACFGAAKDESRPVLEGVRLEVAGGRLTAIGTDSYVLVVRSCECLLFVGTLAMPEPTAPVELATLIPAVALTKALKGRNAAGAIRFIRDPRGAPPNIEVERTDGNSPAAVRLSAIMGDFPNWHRIVPERKDNVHDEGPSGINPFFVARVAEGLGCVKPTTRNPVPVDGGVVIWGTGQGKPKVIWLEGERDRAHNFALVMPRRLPDDWTP